MLFIRRMFFLALAGCVTTAWGQSIKREPHIGYLYPGGGQLGSVVRITAGGQFLRGATDVYVSGQGVRARIIQYMKPLRNLNKDQRELLKKRMTEVRDKRLAELAENGRRRPKRSQKRLARKNRAERRAAKNRKGSKKDDVPMGKIVSEADEVELPDHPLLYELENKSLRELVHMTHVLFKSRRKRQPNRQIAESVLIEITIEPDAELGDRELRIETKTGLTNPMIFQIGVLPEVNELEPNNREAIPKLPKLPNLPKDKPLTLPVLLNGQIMPGDVDRFRFRALKGQNIVIEARARSLIPYLADAVPGWFQATLTLYDSGGKEVAFADDYRFNPDPVLFYRIPANGEYEVEIRDSIYRGREDFIYRIAVGEQPFITRIYPLGGKTSEKTLALVKGWNLPRIRLPLDTQAGEEGIRQIAYHRGKRFSNSLPYAVDTLDEGKESESNNTIKDAQSIELPRIINGRIGRAGDIDIYRWKGHAGDKVVAEVYSRRLNSPLDSLVRLTDASGKILGWNDDYVIKDNHLHKNMMGLVTHHADSYLMAELPQDGTYYVHLADAQNRGGKAYAYRLRIAEPQPDFALRMTPASLSVRAGAIIPVCVHVLRKDGFDGEITVRLKDTHLDFVLEGGRIPSGRDRVRMTLRAPYEAPDKPIALNFEGRARIDGQTVKHRVVPAENVMQAFLYRHLVPSQELLVAVKQSRWRVPPMKLAGGGLIRIPAGGTTRVRIKTRRRPALRELKLEINDPPKGLSLEDVTVVRDGLSFRLKAEKNAPSSGFADNLIVEGFREFTPKAKKGKKVNHKRRFSVGFLPAIPIEVVQ